MIVNYKGLNVYSCEEIRLFPGNNNVPKTAFEKALKNKYFAHRVEVGTIEVVDDDSPFSSKSVQQCKRIVKETFDIGKLNKMLSEESRDSIKKALEDQIKMIEAYGN